LAHHAAVEPCLLLHGHHVPPFKGLIIRIIALVLLLLATKATLLLLLHGCIKVIIKLVKGPIILTSSPAAIRVVTGGCKQQHTTHTVREMSTHADIPERKPHDCKTHFTVFPNEQPQHEQPHTKQPQHPHVQ
jgi:hypothetical protein